ncbi:MAG TPA: GAF domain-containing protein [Acidimicrobiales bacterium]
MRSEEGERAQRNLRLFYLLTVGGWLILTELVLVATVRSGRRPLGVVGGWLFVFLSIGLLIGLGVRELAARRQQSQLLRQHQASLAALAVLTDPSLVVLSVDVLLDEMLSRLQRVLGAEVALVYIRSEEEDTELVPWTCRGLDLADCARLPVGRGLAGRIAAARRAVVSDDPGEIDARTEPLLGLRILAGCPITVEDRLMGICIVGRTTPAPFDERDLQLLQLVGDRVAAAVERSRLDEAERRSRLAAEHARRHVTLLARASEALSTAIEDFEPNLSALVDVAVPDFADWCAVHVVEQGTSLRPLALRHAFDKPGGASAEGLTEHFPEWQDLSTRALRHGRPQLAWSREDESGEGAVSCVVAPIRARGLTLGLITFATDSDRRGYRWSDVSIAEEVAGRAAVAVERVLLYREVNDAAQASARTATQLRQLMEVSISLQNLRVESEVLLVVANHAHAVLDAEMAVVTAASPGRESMRAVARHGGTPVCGPSNDPRVAVELPEPGGPSDGANGWLTMPLPGYEGQPRGSVAIAQPGATSPDDQAVVMLLAQMTAAALESVELYRAVQTREARWRALVEATPAAIVETDRDGRILLWNRFAAQMFGWVDAPEQPRTFAPDTAESLSDLWARAADGEEISDTEILATVAGAEQRYLAISAAPLRASDESVHGNLTLAVDVTERRRLQEGLQEAQRMEALGQVAGGVAHDFNNLLTVIIGYTDLLTRRLQPADAERELFDSIRTAADEAAMLTGQLLTISRRQVAKPVVLAPSRSLQALAEVLQRILGIDIGLHWDLAVDTGNVRIDPGRFEQMVLNLAINARDAMPEGGRLEISTSTAVLENERARRVGVRPGHYVRITVADDGTGMDEETRDRCFDPFFTTKDRSKGTGLGLAAVQGIVADGGGAIQLESTLGVGTTFTVHLPEVEEAVVTPVHAPAVEGPLGTETVLVVDDQPDVRHLIRKVLLHDGYLVLEADSGQEALRIADRWEGPIELLITDVVMPTMRGPEVAVAVRAIRPSISVLFISGYAHGITLPNGGGADPPTVLAKPFKPSELADSVRQILDRTRQRAQTGSPRRGPS